MGRDKALLELGGRPILVHLIDRVGRLIGDQGRIAIACGSLERAGQYKRIYQEAQSAGSRSAEEILWVTDRNNGEGPLAGLHAALSVLPEGYAFTTACDMPFLSVSLFDRELKAAVRSGADAVHAHDQPLHALYHSRVAVRLGELLEREERRFMSALRMMRSELVEPCGEQERRAFMNMNTPVDYERLLSEME
ncbi:molybdenum cofactor guanylyltransferase [Paenibacillus tarimensis]